MLNVKYLMSIAHAITFEEEISQDYFITGSHWTPDLSSWDKWRLKHGIINECESMADCEYVKLQGGIANRPEIRKSPPPASGSCGLSDGFLMVPKEFAMKALVLGHLPE
jgi:hypothetical protein